MIDVRCCVMVFVLFQAIGPSVPRAAIAITIVIRSEYRLPTPRGEKGQPKRTPDETPLECRCCESDPRGDGTPQSLAPGRRGSSGCVDAAGPRRVAAHRPPVP